MEEVKEEVVNTEAVETTLEDEVMKPLAEGEIIAEEFEEEV